VSETASPRPSSRRGRPRTPGAEDRLFQAALEEYGERGWSGFTMDAVARRAGVGKSTIYLRWRDKDTLLADAVEARRPNAQPMDTGTLRGDLEQLTINLFHFYLEPAGWATLRIAVDAASYPEPLGRFADVVADVHRDAMAVVTARATERGERAGEAAFTQLSLSLHGSITVQVLNLRSQHRPVSDEEIADRAAALVAFVTTGLS
jgi:AcrR family transcriptional regulator